MAADIIATASPHSSSPFRSPTRPRHPDRPIDGQVRTGSPSLAHRPTVGHLVAPRRYLGPYFPLP